MCTVSVVPLANGFRVACNRDERRTRARASGPIVHTAAGTTSLWPVDPVSGGTWIGGNDAGLVLVLLNRATASGRPTTPQPLSRGTIIPPLLETPSVQAAMNAASRLDALRFEPFTLVALQREQGFSMTTTAPRRTIRSLDLSRPLFFTSSSLGDELAARWRAPLFATLVERGANRLEDQATFHRHRWNERPELSVLMNRSDAATVSITTIDVTDRRIHMRYVDLERES
jgi:transport and Golgi organization protein 2